MANLLAAFVAGAGQSLAKSAERSLIEMALSERDERMAELQSARDERVSRMAEDRDIRGEERKRAPYREALAATEQWKTGATTFEETSGTAVTREPDEFAINRQLRQELLSRGEPAAAHAIATETAAGQKLDLERASLGRREAQDVRQHDERMDILKRQLLVQEKQLARMYSLDKPQSTALTRNVEFMIDSGIARTPKEAFEALHTKAERSPTQFVEQMVPTLLRGGDYRYRGKDGRKNAVDDARSILESIRNSDAFDVGFDRAAPLGAKRRRPLDNFIGGEE